MFPSVHQHATRRLSRPRVWLGRTTSSFHVLWYSSNSSSTNGNDASDATTTGTTTHPLSNHTAVMPSTMRDVLLPAATARGGESFSSTNNNNNNTRLVLDPPHGTSTTIVPNESQKEGGDPTPLTAIQEDDDDDDSVFDNEDDSTEIIPSDNDSFSSHNNNNKKDNTTTATKILVDPTVQYRLRVRGISGPHSTGIGIEIGPANNENVLWSRALHIPHPRTANECAYTALIIGLQYATKFKIQLLKVELDHSLLHNQLDGTFRVKSSSLKPLFSMVTELRKNFIQFELESIPRRLQIGVHELAQSALLGGPLLAASFNDFNHQQQQQQDNTQQPHDPMEASPIRVANVEDIDNSKMYTLLVDGASRDNPGPSGSGMTLLDDNGKEIASACVFLGKKRTNNQAEYGGMEWGMKLARSLGIRKLQVKSDSFLVVQQLLGNYQVKSPGLMGLHNIARNLMKEFVYCDVSHIRRTLNNRADLLANYAIDNQTTEGLDSVNKAKHFSRSR